MYDFLFFSIQLLTQEEECGTQGKMIASYDAPRKRVCFPSLRRYMLLFHSNFQIVIPSGK